MFNFLGRNEQQNEIEDQLKNQWSNWKNSNMKTNSIFFPIFKDFETEHLKDISGNACRLYILLGLKARKEGHSWYTIEAMAKSLKASTRSVDNWLKELEDRGLITRHYYGKNKTSYLIPYSLNIKKYDMNISQKGAESIVKELLIKAKADKETVGNLFRILHLVQWDEENSIQAIAVITKKAFREGTFFNTAYVVVENIDNPTHIINIKTIQKDNVLSFDSWINIEEDVVGVALEDHIKPKKKNEQNNALTEEVALLKVLKVLCEASDEKIKDFKKVEVIINKEDRA